MRNVARYFRPILDYLGLLARVFGLLTLVPLACELACCNPAEDSLRTAGFGIPAVPALVLEAILKRNPRTLLYSTPASESSILRACRRAVWTSSCRRLCSAREAGGRGRRRRAPGSETGFVVPASEEVAPTDV